MKIAVLMSGGVDSTVAALLLKEQGHEVTGLTMINWNPEVAVKAAEAAAAIGIEHLVIDLRRQFKEKVIDYFIRIYGQSQTPNPCVVCNRSIKFGSLLDHALAMGFDRVATGHYARIEYDPESKRYCLRKAAYLPKDQSYFLHLLTQEQLSRTLFPLGELSKDEVRDIARAHSFRIAADEESQEICFIMGDYRDFLKSRLDCQGGPIVDLQGNILGKHRGLPFYTIGQRKGLGISGGRPLYVIELDHANNRLVLDDPEHLFASTLTAVDNNFICLEELEKPLPVQARIRYRAQDAPALLTPQGDAVTVTFDQPQRAITPGQSVVYYQGEYVLGGGTIVRTDERSVF